MAQWWSTSARRGRVSEHSDARLLHLMLVPRTLTACYWFICDLWGAKTRPHSRPETSLTVWGAKTTRSESLRA